MTLEEMKFKVLAQILKNQKFTLSTFRSDVKRSALLLESCELYDETCYLLEDIEGME